MKKKAVLMTQEGSLILDELAKRSISRLVASLQEEGFIHSTTIEDAFNTIPRHAFINHFFLRDRTSRYLRWQMIPSPSSTDAESWLTTIYSNDALTIAIDASGKPISSSSAPGVMAAMLEALDIRPGMRVLEIGTGTGYNAALLAHLVGNPHAVFSVEINAALASSARQHLDQVVGPGVTVHIGDGFAGYAPGAPYDRLIATASSSTLPLSWLDQLRSGGIMVMNLGGNLAGGGLLRLKKTGNMRAAYGMFLAPSFFMEMQKPEQNTSPPFTAILSQYAGRSVDTCISCLPADFDPALLLEFHLGFFLQLVFPTALLSKIQHSPEHPATICFLDLASETAMFFLPQEEKTWRVEIKGKPQIWEHLYAAYQQWRHLGCPVLTDYQIDVDEVGNALVSILRSEEATPCLVGTLPSSTLSSLKRSLV